MAIVYVNGSNLNIEDVVKVARQNFEVQLTKESIENINKSREIVEGFVKEGRTVYGITTGFGKFSDVLIGKDETKILQRNLIVSHACGVGNSLDIDEIRGVMLLRINALAKGFSGIRLSTLQTLIDMLNKGVHPYIPEKGSLGASGDLAPLAHMVLVMIGEGKAFYEGNLISGREAMKRADIDVVELTSKEGLALINGTQVMTSIGALSTYDAINIMKLSDICGAMTMEALGGIIDAFDDRINMVREHPGQMSTSRNIRNILKYSENITSQGEIRVQDPYTIRCIPQVHGASKDAVKYGLNKVNIEINSVTDNPIIFADDEKAISGGNFHGQPMALTFDFLKIAVSEIANISERRIERLVNPMLSGLPAFLTEKGGINSGLMIAQYCAASLVSENKVLSHPASVDSIPSSANQEDHVSMGTIGARKLKEVVFNTMNVLAIEMLCSSQAIEFKGKSKLGVGTKVAYECVRNDVPKLDNDRVMHLDIDKVYKMIKNNKIVDAVEKEIGAMSF